MTRWIKIFAYLDLLLGVLLMTPLVGAWVIQLLHSWVAEEALIIDSYHAFLMKMLGLMVALWAMVRLQHTSLWQVAYDCTARLLVLVFMGYYYYNGLSVLLFFMLIECLGLFQWWIYQRESVTLSK